MVAPKLPSNSSPATDWLGDDDSTVVELLPEELAEEEVTPSVDPRALPGYDPGWRAGMAAGTNLAIRHVQEILIAGKTRREVVDRLADMVRQRLAMGAP